MFILFFQDIIHQVQNTESSLNTIFIIIFFSMDVYYLIFDETPVELQKQMDLESGKDLEGIKVKPNLFFFLFFFLFPRLLKSESRT